MVEFGEDLGKSSTYVKAGGAVIVTGGVITGNPALVTGGVTVYKVGDNMDNVSTAISICNDFAKGNNAKAVKDITIKAASFGIEKYIDTKIPIETQVEVNTITKYSVDKVIGKMKENDEKGHNN